MRFKSIMLVMLCFFMVNGAFAQLWPGGVGADPADGGSGGDVQDVNGGTGTTGGNQGTSVPIDGGISFLVAAGAVALGKKLYKKNNGVEENAI